MEIKLNNIEYLIGSNSCLDIIKNIKTWKPFDDRVIDFCDGLSKTIVKDTRSKRYAELISLAFWMRKSNFQKIKQVYGDLNNNLGVGLIFHIAPGNMALSFAYSMITGLLTGNTNVIRLPSREFEQANIFIDVLKDFISDNKEMADRICLIKYPHDKDITDELSRKCHMRIIWGGDNTVNTIRLSPLSPRASEITFANRISICIINSDNYLQDYNPKKTAHDFYLDTFLSDQNACSSPRIVYWMGGKITEAKEMFWNALAEEIGDYNLAAVRTSDKLITFCKYASENKCRMNIVNDYKIMRISVDTINYKVFENIGNSGFFYECTIDDLKELLPICKWNLQTISYIGIDSKLLQSLIIENGVDGVDRIVPVGKTMDFDFFWDGKDIIREMTRIISRV